MAGTLKNLDCHPIKTGGIEDHVHVFSSLSKNIAFSDLIGRLKGVHQSASKRRGSMALGGRMDTVPSPSASPMWNRSRPIANQAEHHKKFSYQEEIREIFERHRVAFDER
jgi:hypothetical protein